MPVDPLYSDSALLHGVANSGCPNSAKDVSFTNLFGEPVVTDLSNEKQCMPDMFKSDQFLANTDGCCVLDSSAANCVDIANVDAEEENNYYMGVRYFDVTKPSKGQRKICYTTPIRKKKLNIMELLSKVATDIIILIIMVLIAACYEYWIVYGFCNLHSIKTNLDEAPYSVNTYQTRATAVKKTSSSKCPNKETPPPPSTDWYATLPYNLITFLNKSGTDGTDTSEAFSLSEIVKIPARSFLLGFFYCIILSRILIKGLVGFCVNIFSSYFDTENSRSNRFIAGVIFVMIFMGLFGNIADKFIGNLPYLNASSLFLLFFIIVLTIWIPSVLGLLILMASFVGYRRKSYNKYKEKKPTSDDSSESESENNYLEYLMGLWDWYSIIEGFFKFKYNVVKNETDDTIIDDAEKYYIKDEDTLDWFFPIRRSKIKFGWSNPDFMNSISSFFKDGWTTCRPYTKGADPVSIEFSRKYWWYLSALYKHPIHLINPFFTLDVTCGKINESYETRSFPGSIIFYIFASFFFLPFRFTTSIATFVILIALCILMVIINLLWISFIFTVIMFSMIIGLFGNMIAFFYLHLYVIIGFFYVPFSDRSNLFKVIKSHGNILTILFCIIVVLAFVNVLHPTSVGVIGAVLGLLIMYKLLASLS